MRALMGKYVVLSIFLLMILSITSCSGTKDRRIVSVERLFNQGLAYFEDEDYMRARETFQQLKDNYPLSKYSIVAELRIADSYYHDGEYNEAILYYEEFKKLHPTNPVIPYILYQIGMSYFNQILSIDRDQTFAENAAKQFKYITSRYPSTIYGVSAKKKLRICKERMAQHEFYVGHFYFKKKKYKGALHRFKKTLEIFPESNFIDTLYLYIGKSYLFSGEKGKARDALILLVQNYPQSKYYGEAQKLLAKLR